ncbi:hypothetical protein N7468_003174 [Penicillium chermesinum]|uniref:HLH DNA binding domain protein n=1 Tax=Penicillium chermesinum TaxID=63820 RepID=A0A9W9TRC0_9EURO|nr:uncharacterized protein N7468_003174 [Penicillium chermesinum]KAJ5238555.1 hypothetical protein N7468_003174 [Penicillium chermesinum]KAJ6164208.1 hypothetical protein N7470_002880 [Penicillium chermesinum]
MMYEDMASMTDDVQRRCSLPSLRSTTAGTMTGSDVGDDRRLPPLPRIDPLPRGPFNPFHIKDSFAPTTPGAQEPIQFKSPWTGSEHITAPPSPANSAESSWQETFAAQKAASDDWPSNLSQGEIMGLIAPEQINRKAPLQQLCGRKRKSSNTSPDPDDQREKHRIAEGNRRKNLSQLHRELDSRIHDFFLERAGWNRSKSLPQSKEHIVQGAIYLIDFMLFIIVNLIRQEQISPQLSERLQPQFRVMQLQQQIQALQQQEQAQQQQIRALKAENEALADRNRALESHLKSFDTMFRSPKAENTSPRLIGEVPAHKRQKRALPGLRVLCDEIGAYNASEPPFHHDPLPSATSQTFSTSYLTTTPPVTGPSSPAFPPSHASSFHFPSSRRHSLLTSP